jgi:hypothetical protein
LIFLHAPHRFNLRVSVSFLPQRAHFSTGAVCTGFIGVGVGVLKNDGHHELLIFGGGGSVQTALSVAVGGTCTYKFNNLTNGPKLEFWFGTGAQTLSY